MARELLIGLMSGTSMDSIDAALISFDADTVNLEATHEHPIPAELRETMLRLCASGADEIEVMGVADRQLGELFAAAANELLAATGNAASQITAIGSHGQTVRHRPPTTTNPAASAFTLQIGDPNTIAALTGITTVADFRRRDVALGGQGAPLAPAFHRAVFGRPGESCAVVNVGGMANITVLYPDGNMLGFDCGPGNVLMDAWIARHRGRPFDDDGQWAASGEVHTALLKRLLSEPFIKLPAPKSTGRELFNKVWLGAYLDQLLEPVPAENVQATLLEYTAQTIRLGLEQITFEPSTLYLCGGGARNGRLLKRLAALIHPCKVTTTSDLGLAPEWVEAAAFAWLARQTLAGLPGNACAVTGASTESVLGAVYAA